MENTITKKEALEYIKQNIGRCNLSSFNVGATYIDDAKTELSTIFFIRGYVVTEEIEFREHQNIPCFKFPHVSPAYMDIHAEYTSESIWGLGTFEYFHLTKSNLDVLLDFIRIITSK